MREALWMTQKPDYQTYIIPWLLQVDHFIKM